MDIIQEKGVLRILKSKVAYSIIFFALALMLIPLMSSRPLLAQDLKENDKEPQINMDSINDLMNRAGNISKGINVPGNIYKGEAEKEAAGLYDFYMSEGFQSLLQSEMERLTEEFFRQSDPKSRPDYYADADKGVKGKLNPGERIYIFISSSVPMETLRAYASSVDRIGERNIIMVMNGFVGGLKKIKPTASFIQKVVQKDPSCDPNAGRCDIFNSMVQIDPLVFSRYSIGEAPAFVYARQVKTLDAEMSEGDAKNSRVNDFLVVRGDVSLAYALELFRRETQSSSLEGAIERLRGQY